MSQTWMLALLSALHEELPAVSEKIARPRSMAPAIARRDDDVAVLHPPNVLETTAGPCLAAQRPNVKPGSMNSSLVRANPKLPTERIAFGTAPCVLPTSPLHVSFLA